MDVGNERYAALHSEARTWLWVVLTLRALPRTRTVVILMIRKSPGRPAIDQFLEQGLPLSAQQGRRWRPA